VQAQSFDRLGCFAYSPEEGTPAADMHDRVCAETARRRAEVVMQLQMEIAEKKGPRMKGKRMRCSAKIFQKVTGLYVGRGQADAPISTPKFSLQPTFLLNPVIFSMLTLQAAMDTILWESW
jgi:ribosomal protein S12 methylthiotransferase